MLSLGAADGVRRGGHQRGRERGQLKRLVRAPVQAGKGDAGSYAVLSLFFTGASKVFDVVSG